MFHIKVKRIIGIAVGASILVSAVMAGVMVYAATKFPTGTTDKWFDKSFGTEHIWPIDMQGLSRHGLIGIAANGEIVGDLKGGSLIDTSAKVFPPSAGWYSPDSNQRVWVADVNGDGMMDFVGVASNGDIYTSINTSHSVSINYVFQFQPYVHIPPTGESGTSFTSSNGWFDPQNGRDRVWPGDINGDGCADIIGISTDGRVYYALSYGSRAFSKAKYISTEIFTTQGNWFDSKYNQRVWPADVNGDGKTDLVGISSDGRVFVALNTSNPSSDKYSFSSYYISGVSGQGMKDSADWFSSSFTERVWPADIDGDGNVDVVGISNDGYLYYYLSRGNGYFDNCVRGPYVGFTGNGDWFSNQYNQRVWPADTNGDGKADFIGVNFAGSMQIIENDWF